MNLVRKISFVALALMILAGCDNEQDIAKKKANMEALDKSAEQLSSCDIDGVRTKGEGILTLSWSDQSKICRTIQSSLGRLPPTNVFRAVCKASSLIGIKGGGSVEDISYQLMNIIEARGLKEPTRMVETSDVVWRIFSGSQGHVTPRDLNVFLRQSGQMARTLSDDGLISMAAVIWEEKKARGE